MNGETAQQFNAEDAESAEGDWGEMTKSEDRMTNQTRNLPASGGFQVTARQGRQKWCRRKSVLLRFHSNALGNPCTLPNSVVKSYSLTSVSQ